MRALRQEMQPANTPVHQSNYFNASYYSHVSPESNIPSGSPSINNEFSAPTPKENLSSSVSGIKFPSILPGVSSVNPIRVYDLSL